MPAVNAATEFLKFGIVAAFVPRERISYGEDNVVASTFGLFIEVPMLT
jgi:hypothetical protein